MNPEEILKDVMFQYNPEIDTTDNKVTVVGAGAVGMAVVISLVTRGISRNLVIIDMDEKKIQGEAIDIEDAAPFLGHYHIYGSSDYSYSKDSQVCVVTAGARQNVGETRLSLVQRNVAVFKNIIPRLMEHSPNAILVIVTNPCDIMAYVAWKLSGLPQEKVFGTGCDLDTARFRALLVKKFGVSSKSIRGMVLGEHGDSSVPVWSTLNIAGLFINDIHLKMGQPDDSENFQEVHRLVVKAAYDVIALKGYTNWAIGLSVCEIVKDILHHANSVHILSIPVKGMYDIEHEVFLSLPCTIGRYGVNNVFKTALSEDEKKKLQESANIIHDVQKDLDL